MTLVESSWLDENVNKVKIIDASWHLVKNRNGGKEYDKEHIEDAIFFNLDQNSNIEKDFGLGQDSKFKSILIKSGHADPTNEREMFKAKDAEGNEILDDAGKPIQVSRNDDLGTDFTTFGRNFATEAAGNRKIRKNNKRVRITEVSDLPKK